MVGRPHDIQIHSPSVDRDDEVVLDDLLRTDLITLSRAEHLARVRDEFNRTIFKNMNLARCGSILSAQMEYMQERRRYRRARTVQVRNIWMQFAR